MKNNPPRILNRQLRLGILALLMTFGSILVLRADATSETSKPAPGPTNAVLEKSAPAPGSTNVVALPKLPALPSSPGLTITTDGDDDASPSDATPHGHTKAFKFDLDHDSVGDVLESILIPVVAILATFGTPVLIVFFICYFKYRRRQENLALVREFLNKGLPVPPELLDPSQSGGSNSIGMGSSSPSRCQSDMRRGFKWAFIGLGVTLALYVSDPHSTTWAWGLIPLVMGVGHLISGWVESRQQGPMVDSRTTPQPPKNPL